MKPVTAIINKKNKKEAGGGCVVSTGSRQEISTKQQVQQMVVIHPTRSLEAPFTKGVEMCELAN